MRQPFNQKPKKISKQKISMNKSQLQNKLNECHIQMPKYEVCRYMMKKNTSALFFWIEEIYDVLTLSDEKQKWDALTKTNFLKYPFFSLSRLVFTLIYELKSIYKHSFFISITNFTVYMSIQSVNATSN